MHGISVDLPREIIYYRHIEKELNAKDGRKGRTQRAIWNTQ